MPDKSKEIVLIGIGGIGGLLAKGFLRPGYAIHPITRLKLPRLVNPEQPPVTA